MLKLFSDVKLVNGYTRSILQDFTRGKYYLIPNLLARFIEKYDAKKELSDIMLSYGKREPALFNDYYNLLNENELIFDVLQSHIAFFEEISDECASPFALDCIVFFLSTQNYESINHAIHNHFFENVTNYRIIVLPDVASPDFVTLIHSLEQYSPASCYVSLYKNHIAEQELNNISNLYPEIFKYDFVEENIDTYFNNEQYIKQFPLIANSVFLYFEAKHKNVYFNKRLFIDAEGNIKNTSTDNDMSFGNIMNICNKNEFIELINPESFQKYWHIKKDMIEICKECELRYMCIDNCTPINVNNYWKREKECSYNPYICKWQYEENYVSIKECGNFLDNGFVPNHEKIKALNHHIWGEDDE